MSTIMSPVQMKMQMGTLQKQIYSPLESINNNNINTQQVKETEQVNFGDLLSGAIKNVNAVQKHAGGLKKDFEMGKEGLDLVEVMIASEKSSVAFTALLETRNKLLKAYQDILSTPV